MVRHRAEIWGVAVLFMAASIGLVYDKLNTGNEVIKKVPTTHKVVALTFDDGPHYKTTPQLLAVLREKQVKSTLFILGENAEKHPEILAQAVQDGHEIATHAYTHKLLSRLSKEEYNAELDRAEKVIRAVAPKPTLFRPPGGAYNDGVIAAARSRGYEVILWSIDPGDWRRPSVSHVVNAVLKDVQPGSIVLMHDGQYPLPTPEAVGIIIDKLREQGYTLVTISELLKYYEERE
jgi:polysaccharide deacetylase family sporulation protein PdaB